jgi:hypothetical protein
MVGRSRSSDPRTGSCRGGPAAPPGRAGATTAHAGSLARSGPSGGRLGSGGVRPTRRAAL